MCEQGGVFINGEKIIDFAFVIEKQNYDSHFILQKGKKNFIKVNLN